MYSEKLMDRLAQTLTEIVGGGEGSWQDKRKEVLLAMKERDASSDLIEFLTWFEGHGDEPEEE